MMSRGMVHLGLVAALVVGGLGPGCGPSTRPPVPRTRLSIKQIVERSKPAIVRIEAGGDRVGTGFAISADGLIATNLHVVAGATQISVRMLDGATYEVLRIAAIDLDRDLAVLDIDPAGPVPALPLGDSDAVEAGDPVIAIGNPLGVLDYTVSDGLISSVRVVSVDPPSSPCCRSRRRSRKARAAGRCSTRSARSSACRRRSSPAARTSTSACPRSTSPPCSRSRRR